ncbi:hypothetical protein Tco_1226900 [Tanacetum coccineum]
MLDRRHPWRILVPEETLTMCHTMPEEPVSTVRALLQSRDLHVDVLGQIMPSDELPGRRIPSKSCLLLTKAFVHDVLGGGTHTIRPNDQFMDFVLAWLEPESYS